MIELTKINQQKFYLNPNLIEIIEVLPDTLITITNGKKYYVMESVEEIIERVEIYYRKININICSAL